MAKNLAPMELSQTRMDSCWLAGSSCRNWGFPVHIYKTDLDGAVDVSGALLNQLADNTKDAIGLKFWREGQTNSICIYFSLYLLLLLHKYRIMIIICSGINFININHSDN